MPPLDAPAAELRTDAPAAITQLSPSVLRKALSRPVWLLAVVLGLELAPVSVLPHPWYDVPHLVSAAIAFGVALVFFARRQPHERLAVRSLNLRSLALHLASLALFVATELRLLHAGTTPEPATVALWCAAIPLLSLSLVRTLFPLPDLVRGLRAIGWGWLYAALCTVAVVAGILAMGRAWDTQDSRLILALQAATFVGVKALLGLFYSGVVADPSTLVLGTARFQVQVAGGCCGMEGIALMLALSVGWLIFARRELRLTRAWLLVPASLATIWLLNLCRIAALVAIGDSGHSDVAVHGFHSQAGWILFNAVALAFLLAAHRLRWLHTGDSAATATMDATDRNVAVVYLLPFLAVLATSLISHAASGGFDWLYPLRLAVALAVLWHYRAEYRLIDWRFGWLGPLAGAVVFAIWLGLAHEQFAGTDELGHQLSQLAGWQRAGWISARALAAVVTVPIVEELAFRGYLARRAFSADVEAVSFRRLSVLAILISSLAFGALHGRMWIAGTIAGVVFALVAKLRNRLGEAVAAHATANLLIVVCVLARGDYRMW